MTQYREILRLYQHGISQRSIALSCKCSRNTVAAVVQRAKTANLQRPLDEKTDAELETLLFPEKAKANILSPDAGCVRRRGTTAGPLKSDTLTAENRHPFRRPDS